MQAARTARFKTQLNITFDRCSTGWSRVRRIGPGAVPGIMLPGKKVRSRLNLTGQRVVVSSLACIRWSTAAMSDKSPALAKNARRAGHPLLCVVKAWAAPVMDRIAALTRRNITCE